jgi:HAE1 family hydrophobic/amphiphilic exporter-1
MTALNGLVDAGEGGGVLAVIVLYLFLLRLRPTLVVALAIPVSLVSALGFMYFAGMTLNLVTMVSLIVSVGMLVDDAIVVIENIYRYRQLGKSPEESAERGTSEVAIAITSSTLTTIVVFIPVFYMQSGEMAAYMRQFAMPMTAALMASLLVAFTLIPMTTSRMRDIRLLKLFRSDSDTAADQAAAGNASPETARRTARLGWLRAAFSVHPITRVIRVYARCLDVVLRHRLASMVCILTVIGVTVIWPMRMVGMQDMPKLDMREVDVEVELDQNFNMAMADETFSMLKDAINKQKDELGIKNLFTRYDASGGAIEVYLKKVEDYPPGQDLPFPTDDVLSILWQRLPERLPGARIRLSMPEAGGTEGERALTVSVRLTGDDATILNQLAERFQLLMVGIPNMSDVEVDQERAKQEVQLRVDEPRAQSAGISPSVIARTVDVALRGNRLPYLKQGGREFPVWAQFREEDRKSRANLDNVSVIGSAGSLVPLNQLVTYGKAQSPMSIRRVDGKNVISVAGKISTNDLTQVQKDLNRVISSVGLPLGYTIDLGDEFLELNTNITNFIATLVMAVVLIYIVMAALFESLMLPFSILTTVPLAFIGVYWGMYLTKTSLDTIGLIGCILMVGVVVRNGIVIVDHTNLLRRQGMTRHEAVVQAGRDRFRPVMMTALTTILGVIPLAIESKSGSTVSFVSLGRAFCAGLTTGTILTLVIVPLFYTLIEDLAAWAVRFFGTLASLWSREPESLGSADVSMP